MRIVIIVYFLIIFWACNNKPKTYLNISESVNYVGMNQCAACHLDKYESFIQTGMGKSIRPALKQHSSSFFSHVLYAKFGLSTWRIYSQNTNTCKPGLALNCQTGRRH